jgi:hypothetical protein
MLIPPSMRDCVCFIYANINGEAKPAGTAFFLFVPVRGNVGAIVVVTALHVIAKIQQRSDDGKALLRVNTKDGGIRFVGVDTSAWVKPDQSDEIVDVCFCPWHFPWEASDFEIRYFSAAQVATAEVIATQDLGVPARLGSVACRDLRRSEHGHLPRRGRRKVRLAGGSSESRWADLRCDSSYRAVS